MAALRAALAALGGGRALSTLAVQAHGKAAAGLAAAPAPVVVMHGLFGNKGNWRSLCRRLAEQSGRGVVAVDLRNHGESPQAADMSYPALAGDVLELMDKHGWAQAPLVGHSLGGKVAMAVALEAPERVERLLVVDAAPVQYPPYEDSGPGAATSPLTVLRAMLRVDLSRVKARRDADEQLKASVPSFGLRAFILQNLVGQGSEWRWRIHLDAIADALQGVAAFPYAVKDSERDSCQTVAPYAGKTVFLDGSNSTYITQQDHPAIAALFPAAEIITIPDAGHWLHMDQPELFLQRATEWLASP